MNENKRTATYLAVAALAVLVAWEPWGRRPVSMTKEEGAGDKLFKSFTDPLAATSMRIVKYDEDTGTLHPFQVAQVDGIWSIPSHQNYPADAREHLAEAATALGNLEILGIASSKPGEHELFGVRDPDAKDLAAGATGIGTRVTMKNSKDAVLADLIIGKADKDKPDLHFVRKPSQDQVYRVSVKTDKLSTKFGDWIEKDLLKLNAFDVRSVGVNDYSIVQVRGGLGQLKRSEINLEYDDAKAAWKLADLVEYEDGKPVKTELKDDEELNSEKLNALKTALDDLQIVDVERKPKGLKGLQLLADVANDQQAVQSLAVRGFFPVPNRDGNLEIFSKEGEVLCRMKDGVEYVLRFGEIAAGDSNDDGGKKEDAAGGKGKKDADAGPKVNRYLFVMAQFNPDLVAKPSLDPLPGDEKAEEKSDDKAGDDKSKGDKSKDSKAKGDKTKGDKASAAKTKDEKTSGKSDAKTADAKSEAKPDAQSSEAKTADEQAAEEDAAERQKAQAEKRAAVEKENKRKQDEYDEKLKKGQTHVTELNTRFADWYYIISDDVYHKIHLGRADVVKAKEKKTGEGDTPADLNELEQKGLRK